VTKSRYPTLIALPQVSFTELSEQLAVAGWQVESTSQAPILRGEPEVAMLVYPGDASVIHYTFNPVISFRVLQFRGSNAEVQRGQVGRRIHPMDIVDLRRLLASTEVRQVLLGLFATEELGEMGVVEQVTRLCAHKNERLAGTATRVRDSLWESLNQAAGGPGQDSSEDSAFFSHLAQPELQKQVLRRLLRNSQTPNPSVEQTMNSALQDSDPEVRITAVLAAAKLGATNLISAIREANIPISTSEGAYEGDRFLYQRLRQTAVAYLSGGERSGEATIKETQTQFRKAISGELEVGSDATLLLYALTTPMDLGAKPPRLPDALEDRDGRYVLRRSGLALRWIAPVPHWLGEDSTRTRLPNPIRRATPDRGFFIAEVPIDTATVFWTSDPQQRSSASRDEGESFLCGYAAAAHVCELLGELEGTQLELPSADQWEMAARGPDGRRYPWGNGLQQSGLLQASPWMIRNTVGHALEWTRDVTCDAETGSGGNHIVCGGQTTLACARWGSIGSGDAQYKCAVRPVLNWATH
jgi:hypothetical protein